MNIPIKKPIIPEKPIVKPHGKPFVRGNVSMMQKAKMEAMVSRKVASKGK